MLERGCFYSVGGRAALRETDVTRASPRFRRPRFLILAVAIVIAFAGVPAGLYYVNRTPAAESLAFSEFLQQVERGGVAKVTFGERAIEVAAPRWTHVTNSRASTVPCPPTLPSSRISSIGTCASK